MKSKADRRRRANRKTAIHSLYYQAKVKRPATVNAAGQVVLVANAMKAAKLQPQRLDPTRTGMIRKRFAAEVERRFNRFKKALRKLIVEENAFGFGITRNENCGTGAGGFQPGNDCARINSVRSWESLPKFEPHPRAKEVAESLGLSPDWRTTPANWTSQRADIGKGIIGISPRRANLGTQLHELGHEYWAAKMSDEGREAAGRMLRYLKTLPVFGAETQNPLRHIRVFPNGEQINVQHGGRIAPEEAFAQLFSLYHQDKLAGDIHEAVKLWMQPDSRYVRNFNPDHDERGRFTYRNSGLTAGANEKINRLALEASKGWGALAKHEEIGTVKDVLHPDLLKRLPTELHDVPIIAISKINGERLSGFVTDLDKIYFHPEQAEADYVPGLIHELRHILDHKQGKVVTPTEELQKTDYKAYQRLPSERRARAWEKKILANYDPDQDRDEIGRWTSEGGGYGGMKTGRGEITWDESAVLFEKIRDGGFTYQPVDDTSPTKGYSVATVPDVERVFDADKITPYDVHTFLVEHAALFDAPVGASSGYHAGAWVKDGKVYLDVSTVVADRQTAIDMGVRYNQLGIFDLEKFETIEVPSQRTREYHARQGATNNGSPEEWRQRWTESYSHRAVPQHHGPGADSQGTGRDGWVTGNDECGAGEDGSPGFQPGNTCAAGGGTANVLNVDGNCGIGPHGFEPGNDCAKGGSQTDSPAFKEWFGSSKIVDEQGKPLRVFHSGGRDIDSFKPYSHFGTAEAANDRFKMLRDFSVDVVGREAEATRTYPVYLKMENPLEMPDLADIDEQSGLPMEEAMAEWESKSDQSDGDEPWSGGWESETLLSDWLYRNDVITSDEFWEVQYSPDKAMKLLSEKGYDGIIYKNAVEDTGSKSYIVFDPAKVKSATGNKGTFDPNDPDVRNEFCATGAGGGVDPTCSPGGGGQTDAPEFKSWFGKSKVVDADGKPLRMYHGTASTNISEFLPEGGGEDSKRVLEWFRDAQRANRQIGYMSFRSGTFFSPDPEYAGHYTAENTGVIYPVYIKAENPIYMDMGTGKATAFDKNRTPDALVLSHGGKVVEIAVIDPTQIKSASGHSGKRYDTADIRNENCGTGAGGFAPGNTCAKGGDGSAVLDPRHNDPEPDTQWLEGETIDSWQRKSEDHTNWEVRQRTKVAALVRGADIVLLEAQDKGDAPGHHIVIARSAQFTDATREIWQATHLGPRWDSKTNKSTGSGWPLSHENFDSLAEAVQGSMGIAKKKLDNYGGTNYKIIMVKRTGDDQHLPLLNELLLLVNAYTANEYCATGKDGGVDPTCSPGGQRTTATGDLVGSLMRTDQRGKLQDRFFNRIAERLAELPESHLQALLRNKVRIWVSRRVSDIDPALKGVTPRGWPRGMTWDDADGLYRVSSREVYAARERRIAPGEWRAARTGVLHHELGHAMDNIGDPLTRLSNDEKYQSAYTEDLDALLKATGSHVDWKTGNHHLKEAAATLSYYIQPTNPDGAGRSEVFAEGYSQSYGRGLNTAGSGAGKGSPGADALVKHFPKTIARMKEMVDGFTAKTN